MAISTYGISLMYREKGGGDYKKLVDIKDFPDLGGAPEMLETTTLSDSMQTYIPGIKSLDALEFTANYDRDKFLEIKNLGEKTLEFSVQFGENGEQGMFDFEGQVSVFVVGSGVNEVVEMTITIAPSTPILANLE